MARLKAVLERLLPATLFGRLALLLLVTVVASHVLALTLMFEIFPRPHPAEEFQGPPHFLHMGLMMDIAVRLGALLLAAWVGARWLSEPISRLAGAARELGQDIHRAPLAEAGTTECREATRVFNQMQQRICAQLEQRDQFVAAVSHDLRTPLTRLALRTESLQDVQLRARFGKDIEEMEAMIRATLDYLRGAADPEPWVMLDLQALLHSMAHDAQDCGHDVQVLGDSQVPPVRAQATALKRGIGNLIDNALRYGGSAQLSLGEKDGDVWIAVRDGGPGIPDAELHKVLTPFYRVESSRNRHTGGVGLGLASAADIAERHGGSLRLANIVTGGLAATLTLAGQP